MNGPSDFLNHKVPSLVEIIWRVQADATFPARRRAGVLSSLRRLPYWAKASDDRFRSITSEALPFAGSFLRSLFASVLPAAAGVSRKRLRNAESDCRFVLRHYGITDFRTFVPLSPSVEALRSLITNKYHRVQLSRFLFYLSSNSIEPQGVTDAAMLSFREALHQDWRLKDPDRVWRETIRAWNLATRNCGDWPQVKLSLPRKRDAWACRWTYFPPDFKNCVDEFFNQSLANRLFEGSGRILAPSTVATQKECVRIAASALVLAGVDPSTITGLRDICVPIAFRLSLEQLVKRHGCVSATVGNVAHVLRKIAKYAGVLAPHEIKEVQKAHENLRTHLKRRQRPRKDQDQRLLDRLDDPKLVDALLLLARRTVKSIVKSRPLTRRAACLVQRALILEIWLCAPLRIKNLVGLRLDEHFFKMTLDGVEHIVIRVPADQTKNSEPTEHILNADTAEMLRIYVDAYRPMLAKSPSPWLVPGEGGHHKRENTLGTQMASWPAAGIDLRGRRDEDTVFTRL